MYTKYTCSYKAGYLPYYVRYLSCKEYLRDDCINGYKGVKILCFNKKLFNFLSQNVVKFYEPQDPFSHAGSHTCSTAILYMFHCLNKALYSI